jgi:hypothetical protein
MSRIKKAHHARLIRRGIIDARQSFNVASTGGDYRDYLGDDIKRHRDEELYDRAWWHTWKRLELDEVLERLDRVFGLSDDEWEN